MGKVKILNKIKKTEPKTDPEDEIANVVLPEKELAEKRAKKLLNKHKRADTGVVLLEGIPHGFFETQIRDYFSQFGDVRRIRVGRSKKTGNSKGYAFVEFLFPEVAQIAAEAMNNYMMFKQVMRTKYIPPTEQHPNMFARTEVAYYRGHKLPKPRVEALIAHKKAINSATPKEALVKQNKKQLKKLRKLQRLYTNMDLEFDVNAVLPKEKMEAINSFNREVLDKKIAKSIKKKEKRQEKKLTEAKLAPKTEEKPTNLVKQVKKEKKSAQVPVKVEKSAKKEKSVKREKPVKKEKPVLEEVKVEKKKSVSAGRIEKKKPKGAIKKESLQLAVKQMLNDKKQGQPKVAQKNLKNKPKPQKKVNKK